MNKKGAGSIILGVDPGTHRLGIGAISKNGNKYKLIFAKTIQAPKSKSLHVRLAYIWKELKIQFQTIGPSQVAIEDIFQGKNARSAFHLGLARGLVMACCIENEIDIFEYPPTKVKQSVTGSGRADKEQVKKMTQLLLGSSADLGYDATDALAVALCHASQSQFTAGLNC